MFFCLLMILTNPDSNNKMSDFFPIAHNQAAKLVERGSHAFSERTPQHRKWEGTKQTIFKAETIKGKELRSRF